VAAALTAGPSRARIWAALWIVYLVWGSTYLAIRVVVHPSHGTGLPPLLAASVRFGLTGFVMLALTIRTQAADGRPDPLGRRQWVAAAVVGTSLLLGGNGLVSLAEKRVASGPAAVIIATVPIWAALVGALAGQGRVTIRHGAGLVLGFAGVTALVAGSGSGRADVTGVLVLVGAALSWAAGSVWSRTAPLVRRPLVMTAMQMICGGIACAVAGLASGELGQLHLDRVPAQSWFAIAYLAVVGSMVGYTAYVWLLGNAPLSLVTTYAYVNPLVAVVLGALLLHEHLTARTALATVAIVSGVVLMVRRPRERPAAPALSSSTSSEPQQQCA
jgi:drug/metabolite transporter (DMT)-like permease